MVLTYVTGAVGLTLAYLSLGDDRAAAGTWAAGVAVGGCGLISFVRHSVFHRSDAVRMGWNYGGRNDFQIEVGFANLAVGAVAILACALRWGPETKGALVVVFGLYLLGATGLHASELGRRREEGGVRPGLVTAGGAFSVALLVCGFILVGG